MTSLEHVSVKHPLDHLPSWTGNGDGEVIRSETRCEAEAEELSVGVGMTPVTPDEERDQVVGIAVEQGLPRAENENGSGDKEEREVHEEEQDGRSGARASVSGSASGSGLGASSRSPRGVSPPGLVSHSRSRSPSDSISRSPSRSQSSMRGPLGTSVATSWTQADVEGVGMGGRPSVDGDSDRPSGDVHCRSSTDRLELEGDVRAEERRVPRYGTEPMSLPRLRAGTDAKGGGEGGNVSREEVLVIQEEDLGEAWHPLRYNGKERSQDDKEGEGEKGEAEGDVGSAHALGSIHDGSPSLKTNEERSRTFESAGRNPRHLQLEFKPPSPQPWDEIDPPTDNNETSASDFYSTLNSKKFEVLQKSRRRPLIPHSSYYFGPPPPGSAFGTSPVGQIGVHHPREIVRIERDYAGGELCQFSPVFPLEFEGRITPTQFHQTINDINESLISAHSIQYACLDNCLAIFTLQLSSLFTTSHYTKEMRRLKKKIEGFNTQLYNPVGLNILWPEKVAFLFLEIEYY